MPASQLFALKLFGDLELFYDHQTLHPPQKKRRSDSTWLAGIAQYFMKILESCPGLDFQYSIGQEFSCKKGILSRDSISTSIDEDVCVGFWALNSCARLELSSESTIMIGSDCTSELFYF